MKVVIFGSRRITSLEEVEKAVEDSGILPQITEIVSGGAQGVDTSAIEYAEKHKLPVKLFPAHWEEDGRMAGPLRNIEMAAYADYGVAVWDGQSHGTAHMIGLMEGRVFVWQKATETMPEAGLKAGRRRLLILDLDGTLWGGSAAADIIFGPGDGWEGRGFLAFQQQVKALTRRGLILAVCSRNTPSIARRPFLSRDDMPLSLEDFAAFKANWAPKPDNILSISRKLRLPLTEMVFADNDPRQRAEVRHRLPEVAVPELPSDPWHYMQALKRGGWFKCYFEAKI